MSGPVQSTEPLHEQLKVYALLPLDKAGAALYLRTHLGMSQPELMLVGAWQFGLGRLSEGPGGLVPTTRGWGAAVERPPLPFMGESGSQSHFDRSPTAPPPCMQYPSVTAFPCSFWREGVPDGQGQTSHVGGER